MSCSENDGDTLMLLKEQLESSSTDEGSCSGSSTGGGVTLKKGPWTTAEDALLISYVRKHGEGNWNAVQRHSGLLRCGKSCRLRWANHLRPHLKKGAFSPEEEQFIIQMHSKIGNRWARMAALLPGRTDNEIKNYWNTRVKRRSRAGLPLYPPKANLQTSNESQLTQNQFSSGSEQNTGVLPGTMNGALEFGFPLYKANPGQLPDPPPFSDIPFTGMPSHGLGYYTRSFLNPGGSHVKQSWQSETSFPRCHVSLASMVPAFLELPNLNSETSNLNPGLGYPCDPGPESKNLASFICSIPANPALTNGNFSSSRLLPRAVKMELPSLQYPEADYIDWNTSSFTSSYDAVDAYIQSPENASVQSDCASPRNKGLLEDLVQESQAISSGKKQSFEKSCDHAITGMTGSSTVKWEEIRDPTSPFCLSAVSLFNECNPAITSTLDGISACETPMGPEATMLCTKEDNHAPNLPEFLRPDVLLGSGWLIRSSPNAHDSIAGPLGENLREGVPVPSGMSSMASLDSYPWTNMPRVCQMSEH